MISLRSMARWEPEQERSFLFVLNRDILRKVRDVPAASCNAGDTGAICGWLMSSKAESYVLLNLRADRFAMRSSRFDLRSLSLQASRSPGGKKGARCAGEART